MRRALSRHKARRRLRYRSKVPADSHVPHRPRQHGRQNPEAGQRWLAALLSLSKRGTQRPWAARVVVLTERNGSMSRGLQRDVWTIPLESIVVGRIRSEI